MNGEGNAQPMRECRTHASSEQAASSSPMQAKRSSSECISVDGDSANKHRRAESPTNNKRTRDEDEESQPPHKYNQLEHDS